MTHRHGAFAMISRFALHFHREIPLIEIRWYSKTAIESGIRSPSINSRESRDLREIITDQAIGEVR
jgi:hypothetical protein